MSHELRTPLNSLLILARLLAQNPGGNLTTKQVEYANVIHSAGSDLLQLINDILDLSKVEVGRMDIHPERFTLHALLDDIQATFQPLTAEKGLDLRGRPGLGRAGGDVHRPAAAAPGAGQPAVQRGQVHLGRARSSSGSGAAAGPPGEAAVAFSVTDTGIGIAPENLDAIFGAFEQGDGTLSRRYGGTGLGLSIAREVGALLGGDITADSELGRGSTFTLYVPCTLPQTTGDQVALLPSQLSPTASPRSAGGPSPAPRPSPLPEQSPQPGRPAAPAPAPGSAQPRPSSPPPTLSPPPLEPQPGAHRLLVLESAPGGLLTLLAYSAASDLADVRGPVQVQTVTRPDEAVDQLRSAPHQCVVLDLGLPGAAAFTFLDQLRDEPALSGLPVLAHTRDDQAGAQARLAHYQLAEHQLTGSSWGRGRWSCCRPWTTCASASRCTCRPGPPVRPMNWPAGPARTRSPARRRRSAEHQGLAGKKVLVVDDDVRNVYAITSSLEQHGVHRAARLRRPRGHRRAGAPSRTWT